MEEKFIKEVVLIKDVRREMIGSSDFLVFILINKDILEFEYSKKNDFILWKGINKGRKRGKIWIGNEKNELKLNKIYNCDIYGRVECSRES